MTILKKGVTTGSFINVKKICEALGITVDELENRFKNTFDNNDKNQALNLTSEQFLLIEQFSKLNTKGKKEAIKRIEELSYIEKYKDVVSNQSEQSATSEIDNTNLKDASLPKEIINVFDEKTIKYIIEKIKHDYYQKEPEVINEKDDTKVDISILPEYVQKLVIDVIERLNYTNFNVNEDYIEQKTA